MTITANAPNGPRELCYVAQFNKYAAGTGRFPSPNGIPTARTHELIHYAQDQAGVARSVFAEDRKAAWHERNTEACRADA
jgi:hypothetical protein